MCKFCPNKFCANFDLRKLADTTVYQDKLKSRIVPYASTGRVKCGTNVCHGKVHLFILQFISTLGKIKTLI